MKKLLALSVLIFGMPLMGMEPAEPAKVAPERVETVPEKAGWIFTNTTGAPIALRWYKASVGKFSGAVSSYVPKTVSWFIPTIVSGKTYGTKEEISNLMVINDNGSQFIPMPESQTGTTWDTSARRELLISHQRKLLSYTVETDEIEKLGIRVVGIADLPDTRGIVIPRVSLIHVRGKGIEVIPEKAPPAESWTFLNKAKQPVYCGWYQAVWDRTKQAFLNPTMLENHEIIIIDPERKAQLEFPQAYKRGYQRQLLCSFNKALLTNISQNTPLPKKVIVRTQHDLQPFKSTWQIFDSAGIPYTSPLTNIISIVNTTNKPLYGAMYYVSEEKALKFGPHDLVTEISPQLSAQMQYPLAKKESTIQLFVALEKDKHLLHRPELSLAELTQLYKKNFSKTNRVNWYWEGAYSILPTTKNEPYNFSIESAGGGGIERALKAPIDISSFNPNEINELEARFKKGSPLFRPDEDIIDEAHKNKHIINTRTSLKMENDYIGGRLDRARVAINELLGPDHSIAPHEKVPKIALVFTGGGYRAMIETIGFLRGAQKNGILDCVAYMMGLSGSTWAINPLVASGKSPQEFSDEQRSKVNKGPGTAPYVGSLKLLVSNVIKNPSYIQRRFIESRFGQYHGPIGLYGHALANALLDGISIHGKTAHNLTLSDLRANLDLSTNCRYPLPISVAVDPGKNPKNADRVWYEFSPFYSGTILRRKDESGVLEEHSSWVDSKLFGSSFKNGQILHYVPEYPLAHYMGIWGSAFALNTEDLAKLNVVWGIAAQAVAGLSAGIGTLYNTLLWKDPDPSATPGRPIASQMPNPSFESNTSPRLSDNPFICLIDGGIIKETKNRHNFASVPALWRDIDILIMCDSTGKPNGDDRSRHLVGAAQEAAMLTYAFPSLFDSNKHEEALKNIPNQIATLFVEEDKPIVVYMKGKKNEQYKNPFIPGFDPDETVSKWTSKDNFDYTPTQFDALSGLTEYIMSDPSTVDTLKEALHVAIQRSKQ